MLERVAVGQVRFNLPGLTLDGRGVAVGRQLAVRFGALDRLVSFLRLLTAEQSLDDVPGGVRIVFARSGAGVREVLGLMALPSTGWGDTAARVARTTRGQAYTGSGRQMVQWRDVNAPLGYDVVAASAESGELVLHGLDDVTPFTFESELPLGKLLLRLQPQRDVAVEGSADRVLYLTVRRGLGAALAAYLARAAVRAHAAPIDTDRGGGVGTSGALWLFRLHDVPERMIGLLARTPGFELFVPTVANVAVTFGHRHPVHLDACSSAFPADKLFLFPAGGVPLVIAPLPTLASVQDLVEIQAPAPSEQRLRVLRPSEPPPLTVPLRLELVRARRPRVCGALLPWSQARWLRRLCHALPATVLSGHRAALLERGLLLVARDELAGLPFGTMLEEAAPGVLVPAGCRISPSVAPELVASRMGATGGALVVFPAAGEPPFRVPGAALVPLERHLLAELEIQPAATPQGVDLSVPAPVTVEIENDRIGPMPLWGLPR